MTKEEIKETMEAIEELDDVVLDTIIQCCKELHCQGTQMCFWDRDAIMDVIDKVLEED